MSVTAGEMVAELSGAVDLTTEEVRVSMRPTLLRGTLEPLTIAADAVLEATTEVGALRGITSVVLDMATDDVQSGTVSFVGSVDAFEQTFRSSWKRRLIVVQRRSWERYCSPAD